MNLNAIDYCDANAPSLFTQSLRDTGFGVLKNHPISERNVRQIYTHWQSFFESDAKHNFLFNKERFDGFFPADMAESVKGHTTRDLKEYFHYYPWGQCPDTLRHDIENYYTATTRFAAEILDWVHQHTPEQVKTNFSEPLSGMIKDCSQSLLRILHYPPIDADHAPDAVRAQAHEDINLLTILPAANEPGLQVQARNGEWLDVPCEFGHLIINTGDMLQEVSDGYYPSTTHRVINPDGFSREKSRVSLPLFLHPRPEVVLSKRYTAGSYLSERIAELQESS